jgi:hypothetical protein
MLSSRPRARAACSTAGKLYDYPLVPMNALRNLGPVEMTRCAASPHGRVHPPKNQDNLEGFREAVRLAPLSPLLQDVHRKVWGVPVADLSADQVRSG